MTYTLGVDLSITSPAMVVFKDGRLDGICNPQAKGSKRDGYAEHFERFQWLASQMFEWLVSHYDDPDDNRSLIDMAILEAPSFASKFGNPHERAGLWWETFGLLYGLSIPTGTVAPKSRAKYITGSGSADKAEVMHAARELWGYDIRNDDVADAAGMADMAARRLGTPVVELSDKQLEVMEVAKWPT